MNRSKNISQRTQQSHSDDESDETAMGDIVTEFTRELLFEIRK